MNSFVNGQVGTVWKGFVAKFTLVRFRILVPFFVYPKSAPIWKFLPAFFAFIRLLPGMGQTVLIQNSFAVKTAITMTAYIIILTVVLGFVKFQRLFTAKNFTTFIANVSFFTCKKKTVVMLVYNNRCPNLRLWRMERSGEVTKSRKMTEKTKIAEKKKKNFTCVRSLVNFEQMSGWKSLVTSRTNEFWDIIVTF